jgi:3',5'-cyclic AMP phosphodiesterase CpdA
MTRIALLADLHFGSVPEGLEDQLHADLESLAPDLIVIAGDMTLRSRRSEFDKAKAWLGTLHAPLLLLPGNHDVPVWNLVERFTQPFARYSKSVGQPLMPVFEDAQVFVVGLNTTSSWHPSLRWQEGTARRHDIAALAKVLAGTPHGKARIVATHHPLAPIEDFPRARPVRRALSVLEMLSAQRVEMAVSGHIHQAFAVELQQTPGRLIAVGAPTALSWRVRGEPNGFWLIEVTPNCFRLTLYRFDGAVFAASRDALQFNRAPSMRASG